MKTITVGRSTQCDIIIPDEKVSRVHAEISRSGGNFIFHEMGSNGSNIGGRMVYNERVSIAPGTTVLLANRVPLPWQQVYALLPDGGYQPYTGETRLTDKRSIEVDHGGTVREDKLGIGWGILAFLIPLAGWIMYFVWKSETPNRAKWAGGLATLSFVLGLIYTYC